MQKLKWLFEDVSKALDHSAWDDVLEYILAASFISNEILCYLLKTMGMDWIKSIWNLHRFHSKPALDSGLLFFFIAQILLIIAAYRIYKHMKTYDKNLSFYPFVVMYTTLLLKYMFITVLFTIVIALGIYVGHGLFGN